MRKRGGSTRRSHIDTQTALPRPSLGKTHSSMLFGAAVVLNDLVRVVVARASDDVGRGSVASARHRDLTAAAAGRRSADLESWVARRATRLCIVRAEPGELDFSRSRIRIADATSCESTLAPPLSQGSTSAR